MLLSKLKWIITKKYKFNVKEKILVYLWKILVLKSRISLQNIGPDGRCFLAAWAVSKSAH